MKRASRPASGECSAPNRATAPPQGDDEELRGAGRDLLGARRERVDRLVGEARATFSAVQ